MSKNFVLIGFMGVGKGTIARALVQESGFMAIDTDDLIESMESRKIKDIFETDGEPYFRDLEKKVAKWLAKNVKNTLISTGGGFFKVKNLNKIGKVIYLESSFEGIVKRLEEHPNSEQKFAKRPLLKDIEKAQTLFKERAKAYREKADFIVNVEDRTVLEIVSDVLSIIEK